MIARAAAILREVSAQPQGLSLGQLAAATGLARSTVQRIVHALQAEHLVQAGVGGVRPGWGLRHLGEQAGPDAVREIRPHLYRLYETTRETVDLSTLWDGEVLFLDRFLSGRHLRVPSAAGTRFPAYAMANGKALLAGLRNAEVRALYGAEPILRLTPGTLGSIRELLAQLDDIRGGEFAYDLEEHAAGSCAIGLPLQVPGHVPLAISVVLPMERFEERRQAIEQALVVCIKASSRQLCRAAKEPA